MSASERVFVRIDDAKDTVSTLRAAGANVVVHGAWAEIDRVRLGRDGAFVEGEAAYHAIADLGHIVVRWMIHTTVDLIVLQCDPQQGSLRTFQYDGNTRKWQLGGAPTPWENKAAIAAIRRTKNARATDEGHALLDAFLGIGTSASRAATAPEPPPRFAPPLCAEDVTEIKRLVTLEKPGFRDEADVVPLLSLALRDGVEAHHMVEAILLRLARAGSRQTRAAFEIALAQPTHHVGALRAARGWPAFDDELLPGLVAAAVASQQLNFLGLLSIRSLRALQRHADERVRDAARRAMPALPS